MFWINLIVRPFFLWTKNPFVHLSLISHLLHPQRILFTWSTSDRSQMSRIDLFLISKSLLSNVVSCDILPNVLLDHDFVYLEISVNSLPNHRANVWCFNNSLLLDPNFTEILSRTITNLKIPDFGSLHDWWDHIKIEIRNVCIIMEHAKRNLLIKRDFLLPNNSSSQECFSCQ